MLLASKSLARSQQGGLFAAAAAIFAAGVTLGALIAPAALNPTSSVPPRPPAAAPLHAVYSAQVVRVIDGDTFDARVQVWPGMEAVTRVRLRGIDAPEMKARCAAERDKAIAARDALARMLAAGAVGISNVGQDKYGGRVDADASAASTPNIADAIVALDLARRYDGGRRAGWCD
jgi:endonuclease YncB( thermonuclease family)